MMIQKSFALILIFALTMSAPQLTMAANSESGAFKSAIEMAKKNRITKAISVIESLIQKSSLNKNLLYLTLGRLQYQKNNLALAIDAYNKVEKESDYWVDALEEKAWAYTRNQDYNKALAELKSILNPVFINLASPESVMLAAFVDLKICNYKGVAEKIPLFKKLMLPKVEGLEMLVKNPKSDLATQYISKMKEKSLTAADIGQDVVKLPRYFYRDTQLAQHPELMKKLAQNDLDIISKNLKKMKIIEIELIQRTQTSDVKLAEDKDLKFDKTKSKDALVFPVEQNSNEIWLDEIGKFDVQTTQCPTNPKSGGTL